MHFEPNLIDLYNCGTSVLSAARSGDFVSVETVDHACYLAGTANAFRSGSPRPVGSEDACSHNDSVSDAALFSHAEQLLSDIDPANGYTPQPVGFSSVSPWMISIFSELALRLLRRWAGQV